jgi:hypothetical protein
LSQEVICTFGRNNNLQGITCIPEKDDADYMLVLLNAGAIHKVGPFRMNVDIARHVAENHIKSFRFDVGGLGDSEKVQSSSSYEETVINDIKDALNYLESKYGIKRFIVIGLCTGADYSHKIATKDDRVAGCIWLDGYGYPTAKFYFYRYAPILISPKRILKLLSKILFFDKLFRKNKAVSLLAGNNVNDYVWKLPPKKSYIDDMLLISNRGVKCLYIFTGGVFEYYNYGEQFNDAFGKYDFMKHVQVEYLAKANHTYVILQDKQDLKERITKWLKSF